MRFEEKIKLYNYFSKKIGMKLNYFILENRNEHKLWSYLINKGKEKNYNLIISLQLCVKFLNFKDSYTPYEEKVYKNKKKTQCWFIMIETIEKILGNNFNEMIKKDLEFINKKNIWVTLNLDNLYFVELNHINNIELKIKNKLHKKIIDINIIVSTLEKLNGVHFYTKLKEKTYPRELIENINFTKGYLICFEYKLVEILKKYKYLRKLINKKPIFIVPLKKNMNFSESLENCNYSNSVWLNNQNINMLDNLYKIYGKKMLKIKNNIKIFLNSINFLNSIEIIYSVEKLNIIDKIISENTNIHHTLSNKTSLENIILKIKNTEIEYIEVDNNLVSLVQSAAVLELIKTQLEYYKSFYFEHRLDQRYRIYPFQWPINYQLNHIVRILISFNKKTKIEEIWKNFKNSKIIKKYLNEKYLLDYKDDKEAVIFLEEFFKNKKIESNSKIEEDFKKEYIYQTLLKLVPKKIKDNKIKFISNIVDNFIKNDISKEWEYWLKILEYKKKKLPYLIDYHVNLKNNIKNNFENLFWCDASSNAIQLISLRLGSNNKKIFELTNIHKNETGYSNIYEYVTEEIKKLDHSKIIQKLENTMTQEEICFLQEIENNKYMIMPWAYGMGKYTYRKRLDEMIKEDDRSLIWEKLNKKDKEKLTDYFWDCAEEILTKIGFNMGEYKKICKNFWEEQDYNGFIWKNDLGLILAPVSFKNSKRDNILKKLNIIKLKKKETENEEILNKLKKEEKIYKEKLKKNEKEFWKRSMIETKKNKIFSRIYFKEKYKIDKNETRTALIPNTIHSYDASIMHLTINICKKIGIKVLPIHDSLGCNCLEMPMLKMIFKISNILLLDINCKRKVFPFKEIRNEIEKDTNFLEKMLKSKDFFK